MKIACLLPVYGHFHILDDLLKEILNYFSMADIVIVNDGSPDFEVDEIIGKYPGLKIISHEKNRGKGAALKSGLQYLQNEHYAYALCMDADGQHDPEDIPAFLKKAGDAEIVIGNRMDHLEEMPLARILSNKITSMIIRRTSGLDVRDSQNGFRLVNIKSILDLQPRENGFQFESEMLFLAGKKELRLQNVPVKTIYNKSGSAIHHIGDTLRFIRLAIKHMWSK